MFKMEPKGTFSGNTLSLSWNNLNNTAEYMVHVEQCRNGDCSRVYQETVPYDIDKRTKIQRLTATDDGFEPCTFYNVKVTAYTAQGVPHSIDDAILAKSQNECDGMVEAVLLAVLIGIVVLIFLCIGVIWYLNKKKPIQRIQRVRSKVYCRLYSKDKYEKPVRRENFIGVYESKLKAIDEDTEDGLGNEALRSFREEFDDLEKLCFDTIQRKTMVALSGINVKRNRYQDIVPFDSNRVKLSVPLPVEDKKYKSGDIHEPSSGGTKLTNGGGGGEQHKNGADNSSSEIRSKMGEISDYVNASFVTAAENYGSRHCSNGHSANGNQSSSAMVQSPTTTTTSAVAASEGHPTSTDPPTLSFTNGNSSSAGSSVDHTPARYIAAQGPNEDTIPLFWEMIWQQNVRVIVMLTNLIEGCGYNAVKCSQYWPSSVGDVRRYRDLKLQMYDVQEAPTYVVRKLDLSKTLCGDSKEIVQIQCTAWPDKAAPESADTLVQLIKVTRALAAQYLQCGTGTLKSPWLVHCSAGVGRTGTFIAVDQLMRKLEDKNESTVDVFHQVYLLRRERRYMVQNLAQYMFVYKCVLSYIKELQDENLNMKV